MNKKNRAAWSVVGLAVVVIGGLMAYHATSGHNNPGTNGTDPGNAITKTNTTPSANRTDVTAPKPKIAAAAIDLPSLKGDTIIALGGSVGKGWNDFPSGSTDSPIGYLVRGMSIVKQESGVPYMFINGSVGGWGPLQEESAGRLPALLRQYHPKVVIVSWGLLDDMAKKTPHTTFENAVKSEISKSLAEGATVWVVTPPATGASVAPGSSSRQWSYAVDEIRAAKSFHSPKVVVFDLLSAEKHYLAVHHISVTTLDANGWHPNTPGHILAAQLMAQLIMHANPSTAAIAQKGWFVGSHTMIGGPQ